MGISTTLTSAHLKFTVDDVVLNSLHGGSEVSLLSRWLSKVLMVPTMVGSQLSCSVRGRSRTEAAKANHNKLNYFLYWIALSVLNCSS